MCTYDLLVSLCGIMGGLLGPLATSILDREERIGGSGEASSNIQACSTGATVNKKALHRSSNIIPYRIYVETQFFEKVKINVGIIILLWARLSEIGVYYFWAQFRSE